MQCNNCGKDLLPGAEFCGNCGARIVSSNAQPQTIPTPDAQASPSPVQSADPAPQVQPSSAPTNVGVTPTPAESVDQPTANVATQDTPLTAQSAPIAVSPQQPAQPTTFAVQKQESQGLSIASLVLGIFAILSSLLWIVSIPLAIIAIILGFIGKGKGGKGMALAGIILAGISIVISILFLVLVIVGMSRSGSQSSVRYSSSVFHSIF